MLLSIIIPTCQSGKTLEQCLKSVFQQTFVDFEVLLMDNLSTDETLAVAYNYSKNFNCISIVSEKDDGVFDAMNKALQLAKGEWIYFLGSDDYLIDENVLSTIFESERHLKYHVLYGNVFSPKLGDKYDGIFDDGKIKTKNICHQAIFYHRSIFQKFGLYNCKYKTYADWEFNLRWFNNRKVKRKYLDLTIAFFRYGGLSTISDKIFRNEKKELFIKYRYTRLGLKERLNRILYRFKTKRS